MRFSDAAGFRANVWLVWCVAAVVAAGAGCGRRPPKIQRQQTFPAKGVVVVAVSAAEGVVITFNPVARDDWTGPFPSAFTIADGSFEVQTYGTADGAPAGEYCLTVEWPEDTDEEPRPDRLEGRYSDVATSRLKVVIDSAPTDLGTIRLR